MKDIEIAKIMLIKEELTIVLVKDGKTVYTSKERGIKPLYIALTTMKKDIYNCSAADKVVGKSAAWLYSNANIKQLYCNIISKDGSDLLDKNGVKYSSDTIVDYIKNRKKNDMCPVEKIAKNETDFNKLMNNIRKFLKDNNLI